MQQTSQKIDQLQVTSDTLTSRGGLAFFVKYVQAIGILGLLLNRFARIKKSVKGVSVANLFLQAFGHHHVSGLQIAVDQSNPVRRT
jgi:hypothetical protein